MHRKNKYNRRAVDKKLFLLILLGEFIGCIIMCLLSKTNMFKLDVYANYYGQIISSINIMEYDYFWFCFFKFFKEAIVIILLSYTNFSELIKICYLVYASTKLTISLCTFVLIYGFVGQIKFILSIFPGTLLFYLSLFLFFKYVHNHNGFDNKKLFTSILISTLFTALLCIVISILETYVNIKIVKYMIL